MPVAYEIDELILKELVFDVACITSGNDDKRSDSVESARVVRAVGAASR